MPTIDEVKSRILGEVDSWIRKNAGSGISGEEFQQRVFAIVTELNRRYEPSLVRQVLDELHTSIDTHFIN